MDSVPRNGQSIEACYVLIDDAAHVERRARRRRRFESDDETVNPWSYAAKRGRGTLCCLRLTQVGRNWYQLNDAGAGGYLAYAAQGRRAHGSRGGGTVFS